MQFTLTLFRAKLEPKLGMVNMIHYKYLAITGVSDDKNDTSIIGVNYFPRYFHPEWSCPLQSD